MRAMSLPNLVFNAVERAGHHFIARYKPPSSGGSFATLTVTFLRDESGSEVAKTLENEAQHWLSRYPVPVFSSAFDLHDELVDLSGVRESSHLMALPGHDSPTLLWSRGESDPKEPFNDLELLKIYKEISYSTQEQRTNQAHLSARTARIGWLIVFFWSVVGPLAFVIAESQSELLGAAVLLYSIYKLVRKAMGLTGHWPQSQRARDKAAKESRAKHYFYHCEMNPEGFERLKFENFDRMAAKANLADRSRLDG